jgi:hypothetical protein
MRLAMRRNGERRLSGTRTAHPATGTKEHR